MCRHCDYCDNTLKKLSNAVDEEDFSVIFKTVHDDFYSVEYEERMFQDACPRHPNYYWLLDEILSTEPETIKRILLVVTQK